MRRTYRCVFVCILLTTSACGLLEDKPTSKAASSEASPSKASKSKKASTAQETEQASDKQTIQFTQGEGTQLLLKGDASSLDLFDASNQKLATFKVGKKGVVIEGQGRVQGDLSKLKLLDENGELLYSLKRKDESFKLKDKEDTVLARLKTKDYGFKAIGPDEKLLFKAKNKETKVILRDENDSTLWSTKATVSSLALASLGLPKLTLSQRMGLFLRIRFLENAK